MVTLEKKKEMKGIHYDERTPFVSSIVIATEIEKTLEAMEASVVVVGCLFIIRRHLYDWNSYDG